MLNKGSRGQGVMGSSEGFQAIFKYENRKLSILTMLTDVFSIKMDSFHPLPPLNPGILEPLNPRADNQKQPVDYGIIRKNNHFPDEPIFCLQESTIIESVKERPLTGC